jgi:hypothetical protein
MWPDGVVNAVVFAALGGGLSWRLQGCFGGSATAASGVPESGALPISATCGYGLGFVFLAVHLAFLVGLCFGACAGTTGSVALGWWWTASPSSNGGAAARLALYASK